MPLSRAFSVRAPRHLALACTTVPAYASGDDHAWEYEAAFDIQESTDTYSLNMANNADATMKFASTPPTTRPASTRLKISVTRTRPPDHVTANAPAITIVSGTTYQVTMDPDSWLSVFNVKFPANGAYAFFAEHMPSEFHFAGGTEMELLKDGDSHDVTAAWASTDVAPASRKTPWGNTMLGCLFVWAVTLCGLVLIINTKVWELVKPYALMFASGTLLSTAFALVLYESTHLIPIGNDEGLAAGRWTAMILCGFITSPVIAIVLKFFLPQLEKDDEFCEPVKPGNTVIGEGNAQKALDSAEMGRAIDNCCDHEHSMVEGCEKSITNSNVRTRFLMSLIAGDFFHNFTDGIFIGAAFQCNTTLAWRIVAVTVAHEFPRSSLTLRYWSTPSDSRCQRRSRTTSSWAPRYTRWYRHHARGRVNLDTGMLLAYGSNYIYCPPCMFSMGSKASLRC